MVDVDRRRQPRSAEVRAKISATMKERGIKPVMNPRPPTRPKKGTPEYRLFKKITKVLPSAAAHVELRRSVVNAPNA